MVNDHEKYQGSRRKGPSSDLEFNQNEGMYTSSNRRSNRYGEYKGDNVENLHSPSRTNIRTRRSNHTQSSSSTYSQINSSPRNKTPTTIDGPESQSSWFPLPSFGSFPTSAPSDEAVARVTSRSESTFRNKATSPKSAYGSPKSRDSVYINPFDSPSDPNSNSIRSSPPQSLNINTFSYDRNNDGFDSRSGSPPMIEENLSRLTDPFSPKATGSPSPRFGRQNRVMDTSTNPFLSSSSNAESPQSSDNYTIRSNTRTRSRSYSRSPSPTIQRPKRTIITDESKFHNLISSGTSPDDTQFIAALDFLTNSPNPRALVEKQISSSQNWNALHIAALSNPPLYLIYALLLVYPEGVKVKDSEGRLPLHLAAGSETSVSVLNTLVRHFHQSVSIKDDKGFIPLHLALLRDVGDEIPVDVLRVLLGQNINVSSTSLPRRNQTGTPGKVRDGYMRNKNHLSLGLDDIQNGIFGLSRNAVVERERKRREAISKNNEGQTNDLSRGFGSSVQEVDSRDANPLKHEFLASLWEEEGPNCNDLYADLELTEIDKCSPLIRQGLKQLALWKKKYDRNNPLSGSEEAEKDDIELSNPASIMAPPYNRLPLHMAVRRNHKKGHSIDIQKVSKLSPPPNQNSILRILIHAFPAALMKRDSMEQTPLMTCLQLSHHPAIHPIDVDMIELLLGMRTPGFVPAPQWLEDEDFSRRHQDSIATDFKLDMGHVPTNAAMVPCENRLPLHIATREALGRDIVHAIYSCYPGAKYIQDDRKCTPLHCALESTVPSNVIDFDIVLLLFDEKVLRLRSVSHHNIFDLLVMNAKNKRLPTTFHKRLHGHAPRAFQSIFETEVLYEVLKYPVGSPAEDRFFRDLQTLPSWLRNESCRSFAVQSLLRREVASTQSTFHIMLRGFTLVGIIILFGSLVDSYSSSNNQESFVSTSNNLKIAILVLTLYLASSGLLYFLIVGRMREKMLNFWSLVSFVAVILCLMTIIRIYVLEAGLETDLNSDDFLYSLSISTLGCLWSALVGYFARFWYGVGKFCSNTLHLTKRLISPLLVICILTFAFMQMIYIAHTGGDRNNICSMEDGQSVDTIRVCSVWDSFKLLYLLTIGEIFLGDTSSKSSVVVLVMVFIVIIFILVVTTLVTNLRLAEKDQSLVKSFWAPLLTYVLFTRSAHTILCCGNSLMFSSLERRMENAWEYIMISFSDVEYKDTKWWYVQSELGKSHLFTSKRFIQTIGCFIIPFWMIAGLVTLGILWPPQIRWWLFSIGIGDDLDSSVSDMLEDTKHTNELKTLKLLLYDKFQILENELASMRSRSD